MDKLNQAHRDGVVIGLRAIDGIRPRVDIDVMLTESPDLFNMFLIAMMEIKGDDDVTWKIDDGFKMDRSNIMSYHSLAGIHGLPSAAWDDETSEDKQFYQTGYCAHATPSFPTWHRPYLAMLEQVLYRQIQNIAQRFNRSSKLDDQTKKKYIEVAKQFRLPYWDYYRPRGGRIQMPGAFGANKTTTAEYDFSVPRIITDDQVWIKSLPDNKAVKVQNPLRSCKLGDSTFPEKDWRRFLGRFFTDDQDSGSAEALKIYRAKTTRYQAVSNPLRAMSQALNEERESNTELMLDMITKRVYSDFLAFTSTGEFLNNNPRDALKGPSGSLEGLHNSYHGLIGGTSGVFVGGKEVTRLHGHMSTPSVAAFDPIFWLHHNNIDRIAAVWQAANPNVWFPPNLKVGKIPPGGRQYQWFAINSSDPLIPFRTSVAGGKKQYWTSDSARYTEDLGYTYPDVQGLKDPSEVRRQFIEKYGWSVRQSASQSWGTPPARMEVIDVRDAPAILGDSQHGSMTFSLLAAPEARPIMKMATMSKIEAEEEKEEVATIHKWYLDDVFERMALRGTFTIFYFIGDILGETIEDWLDTPGFFGLTHNFAAHPDMCDNCGRQEIQAQLVTNTNSMTSQLLDYTMTGELESMAYEHVKPFLVQHLKWRILKADGQIIDPRDMSNRHSLRISISEVITRADGEGEPDARMHIDIIKAIIERASAEPSFSTQVET